MNEAVVKKTQDTLGKVIKKPALTEKLLTKPPFRYLHDIISEVIRNTGFMKGLYGATEMKSENVKDKDSKIAFLQKAIDVVMLVSGEPLSVKPARIVAGYEPERTNELLQAIARCCINKASSDTAVKRVLAGDRLESNGKASTSRSQDKENREGRERHRDTEERKEISEQSKDQESRTADKERHRDVERPDKPHDRERDRTTDKDKSRDRDKDKGREKEREKDKDRGKDRDKDRDREKERNREKTKERDSHKEKDGDRDREREKERDREKTKERDSHREKDGDREREREKRRDRESEKDREQKRRDRDRERRRDGDKEKEREKDRERHKEGEQQSKAVEKGDRKVKVSEQTQPKSHPEEPSKTKSEPAPTEITENQSDSPARIPPRPSSAKGQRRRPKPKGQDVSDSDGEGDAPLAERPVPLENGEAPGAESPQLAHSNRKTPRPSSARPAPPRIKRQESYTDVTPAERLGSAKPPAAVIMEGKKLSEDEEEDDHQFLVEEAQAPPPEMPAMNVEPTIELQGDEKHGGLVKKILETKKDFESSPSSPKFKDQTQTLVSEAARRKERDLVSREMERLRGAVQTVCRSALPLGKIMDYVQEDRDAMTAELQAWRRENKQHAHTLLEEQRITDAAVEPLQAELSQLEQLIRDQQDKICAKKANILKNEDKIQKMMTSINFSQK